MSKEPTMIVFGASEKPTKTVLCGEYRKIRGTAIAALCEIKNGDGKYDHGDRVAKEDIDGVYATILFCNKKSLEGFIEDLEGLKKAMEGKWRA